ncbi:MAG TPA: hypothetical protein VFW40_02310, partial [Capsulimonadaceae bacterium]|nr:hypothetical protein [Capsulimonadaceae bacterium]
LHQAMLAGGTLLIEAVRPNGEIFQSSPWGGTWVERPDGARILLSSLDRACDDPRVSHGLGRYELIKDGKLLETEFEDFILRRYEPGEIIGLLQEAGFVDIRAYGGYHREPPADSDSSVIVECKRSPAN